MWVGLFNGLYSLFCVLAIVKLAPTCSLLVLAKFNVDCMLDVHFEVEECVAVAKSTGQRCWNNKTEIITLCAGIKTWFVGIRLYGTEICLISD